MNDWTKLRGIEINWPKIFPINSVRAMRGAFYFLDEQIEIESYLESIFKAYWTDGIDISREDCLAKIVDALGVDSKNYIEFINLPDTKNRLVENTQELMERGGFGSPTFFINDKDMYFGNDRLQLIENLL